MPTVSTQNFSVTLPPSLLMSNPSHIDLFVDLKEIQSQMPQVALFPLWEIKRFNSPCLSILIIIISPSSPLVCARAPLFVRLPLDSGLFSLLLLNLKQSLQALLQTCTLSYPFKFEESECSLADTYQQETRVLWGQNDAGRQSLQKGSESVATGHQHHV